MSVFTHGHHEVLRHFQGRRHFARDQRLRLETPGWRVLDFQGNPLEEDELERQRESILKGPLVVRDQEHPFAEDLIADEAGVIDPQLPVLTKVSCVVDALKMGGSYGLIEKLWAQFLLTAGPVKREVAWTRDEVLVGSVDFRNPFVSFRFTLLFCFYSIIVTGMVPRILSRVVGWAKAHHFYGLEFEERGESLWAFMRTWEKGSFRRLAVVLSTASQLTLHMRWRCSGRLWLQWVVRRPSLRFLAGRMCWLTRTRSTWEVGTRTNWWSIQSLTCVS